MESHNLKVSKELSIYLKYLGVESVVVCSGSRNAPLVFTLEMTDSFQIFHHHDERSAAFFALGLIFQKRAPVAVLCTSGTAAAELLPATIEAYYQKLPLILITADRMPEFRGTGAPQSINQVGLFTSYAKTFDIQSVGDYSSTSKEILEFPFHLNICLEEPRSGDWEKVVLPIVVEKQNKVKATSSLDSSIKEQIENFVETASSLLVVVGSVAPEEALELSRFLKQLGAPILADTTANLSEVVSSLVLHCGDKVLKDWKPEKVLRFGGVPSFRFWRDLEENSIELMNLTTLPFSGLARKTCHFTLNTYADLQSLSCEAPSVPEVFERDNVLWEALNQLLKKYPESELAYLRLLSKKIPSEAVLYLGNSLAIREWNLVNAQSHQSYANRGANGIDGQVSTFLGLADIVPEAWAILGDQTALYDLNALAVSNQRSRSLLKAKRRIVVVNNGGGKIFSHLNYSSSLSSQQRKLIENQHRWEFRGWAEMFAWGYEAFTQGAVAFNSDIDDLVLEVFPNPSQTQHFWSEWRKV
ncbi:MAG: 2-succinyl-5-enolpyruvyl-6-hydroxy-3-cyclohexene-1-carboxylic-acid synthase [Bdellovibrionota bacterium]